MTDRIGDSLKALVRAVGAVGGYRAFIVDGSPTKAKFVSRTIPEMQVTVWCRVPLDTGVLAYEWVDGGLRVPVEELDRMVRLIQDMLTPINANSKPIRTDSTS